MVGVVGDVLHEGLDGEAKAEMYVPIEQAPNTESDATIVFERRSMQAPRRQSYEGGFGDDRTTPVDRIETMEQLVSGSVAQPFRTVISWLSRCWLW